MKLFRRLFWPSASAFVFLLVLAIAKPETTSALPLTGFVCSIEGPRVIYPDETVLYAIRVGNDTEDDLAGRDPFGFDHELAVIIDNVSGSTKITGVVQEDDGDSDIPDGLSRDEYTEVGGTNYLSSVDVESPLFVEQGLLDFLEQKHGYHLAGNPCGEGAMSILERCMWQFKSPPHQKETECEEFGNTSDPDERQAWADAVDELMAEGPFDQCIHIEGDKPVVTLTKDTIPIVGQDALKLAGYTNKEGLHEVLEFAVQYCDFAPFPSILDGVGFIEVTCEKAGRFEITIRDQSKSHVTTFAAVCQAPPSDKSVIAVAPNVVEMIPALGNVSHAFVLVTLLDKDGITPESGYEVDFTTDRCSIETAGVDTVEELVSTSQIFAAFSAFAPATSAAIEASPGVQELVDSKRKEDTVKSVSLGGTSRAAAILGCNPKDAPDTTPGIAKITAVIEVRGGRDVVLTTEVRVVGPPAVIEVSAAPATVRCGEKIEVKAKVGDAIGQFVSNQTVLEAVTNLGGILGGTGAVAGNAGPSVPISSTVAETFDGIATFYLLTSEMNAGPYEIVIAAGTNIAGKNGPYYSTPVTVQVQVACVPGSALQTVAAAAPVAAPVAAAPASAPPPPPPLTAPRTGFGTITPPNTGDGGLLP